MNTYQHHQKWSKNPANKKIFGVCSGLARRFELPVWATRARSYLT
ncbi:PspC domain-containing protein [Pseudoalteromonas sp.]